eukprot:1177153-Prorocentrum_minimum.AAC.3
MHYSGMAFAFHQPVPPSLVCVSGVRGRLPAQHGHLVGELLLHPRCNLMDTPQVRACVCVCVARLTRGVRCCAERKSERSGGCAATVSGKPHPRPHELRGSHPLERCGPCPTRTLIGIDLPLKGARRSPAWATLRRGFLPRLPRFLLRSPHIISAGQQAHEQHVAQHRSQSGCHLFRIPATLEICHAHVYHADERRGAVEPLDRVNTPKQVLCGFALKGGRGPSVRMFPTRELLLNDYARAGTIVVHHAIHRTRSTILRPAIRLEEVAHEKNLRAPVMLVAGTDHLIGKFQ